MDRIAALRLFVRVVETGAFSRAAVEIGVAQPVASRAIAALEEAFGARLINRTTRRLSLTAAGERAYAGARPLVDDFLTLEEAVRAESRQPIGLLRLACSEAFAQGEIVPHLGDFHAAFPRVIIDLATSDARVSLVERAADLAFRLGGLEDSTLTARSLGAYRRVLVASPAFIDRVGAPASPAELAGLPCIVFTSTALGARWPLTSGTIAAQVEARGPVRASNGRVVVELTRAGLGVALLPEFAVRADIAAGTLLRVLPDWRGPDLALTALWPSGRDLPRKARAFLEFLEPRLVTSR